jgi:radical SAM superfamily enzyme with C-terminal helix-hairpin-helix motif
MPKIKQFAIIFFFSVWNNLGNYSRDFALIYSLLVSIGASLTLDQFIAVLLFNWGLASALSIPVFFIREYLKSK